VAGADDDVVAVEVELLDREREDRQVAAIVAAGQRQPLHQRRDDPVPFDGWRNGAAAMEQGVDVGVGIELAEPLEHLLAAPHPRQPVVNQRDPRHSAAGVLGH
jgi:hypothetical protein